MKATTYYLDKDCVEVTIEGEYSNGLVKARLEDCTPVVRHKDRLTPIDEEAKQFLGK